jgi:hypothetical protein
LPIFDDQALIEGSSAPIDVRTNFDTNFQDREAFITGNSKYIEEATRHGEFVSHFASFPLLNRVFRMHC